MSISIKLLRGNSDVWSRNIPCDNRQSSKIEAPEEDNFIFTSAGKKGFRGGIPATASATSICKAVQRWKVVALAPDLKHILANLHEY